MNTLLKEGPKPILKLKNRKTSCFIFLYSGTLAVHVHGDRINLKYDLLIEVAVCRNFFLLIGAILFFRGLVGMENLPFSKNDFENQERYFSKEMEGNLQRKIIIYLAGKIPNGNETPNDALHWTKHHMDHLRSNLSEFDVVLLNPAFKDCDLTDQDTVFGRDMHYVFSSDIIFVDARGPRGLGVGAEMMWAKANGIPVISWAPKNTYYNMSSTMVFGTYVPDFIHPFVNGLSDKVAEDIQEGAEWIKQFVKDPHSVAIKNSDSIHSIMEYFKLNQLKENELIGKD